MRACLLMVVAFVAACNNRNNFNCELDTNCDLSGGGMCIAAPTGNTWCAYPDSECPTGYRYSDQDVGDGLSNNCVAMTDAGIDAPNDGVQPEAAFEVIYGDDWRVAVDSTNDGWFLIVANGTIEPDLSTIQVVSVSDAHPIALVRVNAFPSTGTILHGRAAGKISVDNNMVYQQIIMEPRERIDEGFLSLQTLDAPGGDYIFSVHLELSINGIQFPLDFKIHHVDTLVTYNSPETAKRLKVYP